MNFSQKTICWDDMAQSHILEIWISLLWTMVTKIMCKFYKF